MPGKKVGHTAGSAASAGTQGSVTPTPTPIAPRPQQQPFGPRPTGKPPSRQGTNGGQHPPNSGVPASAAASGGNVWKNGGGQALVKSVVTRPGLSMAASLRLAPYATPSNVASQMGQLSMAPAAAVLNPSEGPGATGEGNSGKVRQAPTMQASNYSEGDQFTSIYCKPPKWKRHDFRQGDIIALPFHRPNLNPRVNPNDERLSKSIEGWVYTKRRMAIVMWIHLQDLFCVPLYSFEGKGIQGKPPLLRKEYVSVRNSSDKMFENQGIYPPVAVVSSSHQMHLITAVHIAGGVKVDPSEDTTFCGRTTKEGYTQLMRLWNTLSQEAQDGS